MSKNSTGSAAIGGLEPWPHYWLRRWCDACDAEGDQLGGMPASSTRLGLFLSGVLLYWPWMAC